MSKEADAVRTWFHLMAPEGTTIRFALHSTIWRGGVLVQEGHSESKVAIVNRLLPAGAELQVRGIANAKLTFKWEEYVLEKLELLGAPH